MQLSAPASQASCIAAAFNAKVFVQNLVYGTAGSYHNWASWGSQIGAAGDYTISGGAACHMLCTNGGEAAGQLSTGLTTITLVGTPHFSSAFAQATNSAFMEYDSTTITWAGAATGVRFLVNNHSGIYVPSGTLTYFPGDTAGVADASTFGLYST